MKRQALTLAAAAALGLGIAGYSLADDASNTGQANNSQSSAQPDNANAAKGGGNMRKDLEAANDPDKLYVVMAAIDNQSEIQLGQLAQQKAQNDDVKQIAQKMVQDHQKADQQLKEVAQKIGIQIPESLPMTKQQELTVFQSLNGKQFDQQYISHLRAAHAMCVSQTSDEAQLAQNEQVKQYASQQLPMLEEHSQRLEKCAVALGLPNAAEAQTAGAKIGASSDQGSGASDSTVPGKARENSAGGTTGQQ
jgi:putative membrane protein